MFDTRCLSFDVELCLFWGKNDFFWEELWSDLLLEEFLRPLEANMFYRDLDRTLLSFDFTSRSSLSLKVVRPPKFKVLSKLESRGLLSSI